MGNLPTHWTQQDRKKFLTEVTQFFRDEPYLFKYYLWTSAFGRGSDAPTHPWFPGPLFGALRPVRERLLTLLQGFRLFLESPPTSGLTDGVGHRFSSSREEESLDPV